MASTNDKSAVPDNLKSRMKESYDTIAKLYATNYTEENEPLRLGYLKTLLEHVGAASPASANILELGCGSGVPATKFLLENEKPLISVTGNDISTSQLDLARSALAKYDDRLTLVEGDMLSLSFSDGSLDAVTAFYSIIHLPRDEQSKMMAKIHKWLRPGGYFLATFGTQELAVNEQQHWLEHDKGWMFWSSWGEEGSVNMVKDAGMAILVRDVHTDADGGQFVWVLAKKQ